MDSRGKSSAYVAALSQSRWASSLGAGGVSAAVVAAVREQPKGHLEVQGTRIVFVPRVEEKVVVEPVEVEEVHVDAVVCADRSDEFGFSAAADVAPGYCYRRMFKEQERHGVSTVLRDWPSVQQVFAASAYYQMLSDEELALLPVAVGGGRVHVGEGDGGVSAFDVVRSMRVCRELGLVSRYAAMLVGGSTEAARRDQRMAAMYKTPVIGSPVEAPAAAAHVDDRPCFVEVLENLLGHDVCTGKESLSDVVADPLWKILVDAKGDPRVVYWRDGDSGAFHICRGVDGAEPSEGPDGGSWDYVRLSQLRDVFKEGDVACWEAEGYVRPMAVVPRGFVSCKVCRHVVKEQHGSRCGWCESGGATWIGVVSDQAWLGDLVHTADVRTIVGPYCRTADELQRAQVRFVAPHARGLWYIQHADRVGITAVAAEFLFRSEYFRNRLQYLGWLVMAVKDGTSVPSAVSLRGGASVVVQHLARALMRGAPQSAFDRDGVVVREPERGRGLEDRRAAKVREVEEYVRTRPAVVSRPGVVQDGVASFRLEPGFGDVVLPPGEHCFTLSFGRSVVVNFVLCSVCREASKCEGGSLEGFLCEKRTPFWFRMPLQATVHILEYPARVTCGDKSLDTDFTMRCLCPPQSSLAAAQVRETFLRAYSGSSLTLVAGA